MAPVIEVTGLRKEYRNLRGRTITAIDGLDLHVEAGGVYGFLGPNGSGKTTTIRCLLGLVRPTDGEIRVLGAELGNLASVMPRIGALVEGPKFSPNMSARVNLDLLARMGGVEPVRIHEVLELVELTDRADEPVRGFSLGMAQRLGIAAALLRDPELILLDEPGNGLDPAGIADMRRLVRRLGSEGRTVFVSSHQLHEVQLMCDHVVIVADGRNVTAGSVEELTAGVGSRRLVVTIENRDRACRVLERNGYAALPSLEPEQLVVQLGTDDDPATICRVLANANLYLRGLRADNVSLEEAFLSLTQPTPTSAAAQTGPLQ